jgi:hypothetical protein
VYTDHHKVLKDIPKIDTSGLIFLASLTLKVVKEQFDPDRCTMKV